MAKLKDDSTSIDVSESGGFLHIRQGDQEVVLSESQVRSLTDCLATLMTPEKIIASWPEWKQKAVAAQFGIAENPSDKDRHR